MLSIKTKGKRELLISKKFIARRSRPRAKSVDSYHSGSESSTFEVTRSSTESVSKPKISYHNKNNNNDSDEFDELTSLISKKEIKIYSNRSLSLDSDPQYQFMLYGNLSSFLTSGFSISVKPIKQNSLVTIFAIWNTIIGSSLLAMPWSVQRAGLVVALILMFGISTLAVYTAYCLLTTQMAHGKDDTGDVPYLCNKLLGSWAQMVSRIFSFMIIFGANVVYWILMSNCLYHSVGYFSDVVLQIDTNDVNDNITVLCPKEYTDANVTNSNIEATLFQKIWNLEKTVPIFLILIVAPLLNFKSATFFTKFNSIGTLSVIYLLIFVFVKSFSWGINLNLVDESSESFIKLYEPTFFATSGMLPLSLFIHNIVITLMRNNRDQENNSRDLSIAYILVVVTYLLIGFLFYICFPLKKSCIEDNMLNNFPNWDIMTVMARIFLFFQLLTVFPLLSYMLRIQIFSALNYPLYPSTSYVILLNAVNIVGCVLFAVFLPHIGTIIRFTGAICGFVYVFTLPCLLRLASQVKKHTSTVSAILLHTIIPVVGLVNLVAQFFVSDNN